MKCRDSFRESHILKKIIPTIEDILAAGEIKPPAPARNRCRSLYPMRKGSEMLVIVTEAVPDRLKGFLSRWFLEVRAGGYLEITRYECMR